MDDFLEDGNKENTPSITENTDLKDQRIIKLSEKDHVLLRPGMYLGSSVLTKSNEYILEEEFTQKLVEDENGNLGTSSCGDVSNGLKFVLKEVEYVPGLFKIFNELIDNSIDEYVRTKGAYATKIDVTVDNEMFSVNDNGRGIPVTQVETPEGVLYQPELAWTHARAGSNFEDDKSSTIGTNGVGSLIASVFSLHFEGVSQDGMNKCTVTCTNNNSNIKTIVKPSKNKGVQVTIKPDLARFGLTEITNNHIKMLEQRLHNLSVSYPDITFRLNGNKIKLKSKDFLNMFGNEGTIIEHDNFSVGVFRSDSDDFKHFSLMNGLTLSTGGTHIDHISNGITQRLRDKIVKKYKSIKPADVKQKLFLVVLMKNFEGPKYESQTKEKLTNSSKEIMSYFEELDLDKLSDRVYKNKEITDAIIDYFKIKEEYKLHTELKKSDKVDKKKIKSDKFMSPIGEWKNIYLAEGDSAKNSISKIIGRQGNGFYAMFGVPPNAYDMALKDILASDKMKALQQILGLKFSSDVQDEINFENIIIATDADLPGFFIRFQLMGLFYRFGKNLYNEGRIKVLRTPIVIGTDSKDNIKVWFYDLDDLKAYETEIANGTKQKYKFDYKKGLASWDQSELEYIIGQDGLENMLETMELDEDADASFRNWLSGDMADKRKEMLEGFEFSVSNL